VVERDRMDDFLYENAQGDRKGRNGVRLRSINQ